MEIRTIDDLARVPDEELLACLNALHAAIIEAKRRHMILKREGSIGPATPLGFQSFTWQPRRSQRLDTMGRISADTPIDEIPIRAMAREALKALKVYCVDDLSAISEEELLQQDAIGKKTLARLRGIVARVGLDFLPSPDRETRGREQSKAILALPTEQRLCALRGLADAAPISALGLRPSTLRHALEHGCETVGQLRGLSPEAMNSVFGKSEMQEVLDRLMATDRPFAALDARDAGVTERALQQAIRRCAPDAGEPTHPQR